MMPPLSAASGPDDWGSFGCASGCDSWAPHHVRLNGESCRLCSSCVLLCNPDAYCCACLLLLAPGAYAAAFPREPRVDFSPPDPIAACSRCGVFVAHLSCVADPYSFVCPPCSAAVDRRPFSYEHDPAGRGQCTLLDGRYARVLLAAALLAHDSALRAAAAAREKAERSVQEAAVARKQARAMLDAAFRGAEAEDRHVKEQQATPSAAALELLTVTPSVELLRKTTPKSGEPRKKAPKSNEANRSRDTLLKFNSMQQPALAFAATAAAAAASSMPMPSSRSDQNQVNQEAGGSADIIAATGDYRELFGTLPW
ncbi:uncharacterized protein LOC100826743 [Brachypodium distachyon]|uniref:Uncharacterized protein n=1 Tax=Brachypodium distachyon TaxID=15368 RepID=A0A0Q3QQ30_BRADI|nr:uncharacterized protein LOC100826743 [Brachypodium distachyon]KQK03562.1 hypothetical protein BRADI_2g08590v3 [Brachypodium distachyon]|eukprot:XP_014754345.1 uncharacterized protein LOC100826743 [Brachypodium distachyon]